MGQCYPYVCLNVMNRHPGLWDGPYDFIPEWFLGATSCFHQLMPLKWQHDCIGNYFAMPESKIDVATSVMLLNANVKLNVHTETHGLRKAQ